MQESMDIIGDITTQLEYLDQTVKEVFNTMMGIACTAKTDSTTSGHNITALVGLAGALRGACILKMNEEAALRITSALIDTPAIQVDDLVTDSIGEICNMLAGGWKGRSPQLASACMLSVPMVTTGKEYTLSIQKTSTSLERTYRFENHSLAIHILCES